MNIGAPVGGGDGDDIGVNVANEDGMSGTTVTAIGMTVRDGDASITNSTISALENDGVEVEINPSRTLIDDLLWNKRIQDVGCKETDLTSRTYQRNKIMSVGPENSQLFYYDLTAIAVDFTKIMRDPKNFAQSWTKLPKNNTQVKEKIVERLLALRQRGDDGSYLLDQSSIVNFLLNIWGKDSVSLTPHTNDRVRLFGIVMARPEFRGSLQQLSDGVTSRDSLDNPSLSLKQIFVEIALAFNNDVFWKTLHS